MIFAGTSGFSYTGWRGGFYPERLAGARMLQHYAGVLNAVEINGSFYRAPQPPTLATWAAGTPEGFRFCFKANRAITYSAAAFPKEQVASDFGRRLRTLGPRVGPVLVQFPPTRQRDAGLLDAVLVALDLPAAAEFRHESWFHEDTYRVLDMRGAALVHTDDEKWPPAPAREGAIGYYRLRRDYSPPELDRWIQDLSEINAVDLYVFFRHLDSGPHRALRVLESLSRRLPRPAVSGERAG